MKLNALILSIGLMSSAAFAATPQPPVPSAAGTSIDKADAPAAVTAMCKDGTSFSGVSKKGACSGHKGVKAWDNGTATTSPQADAKADTKTSMTKGTATTAPTTQTTPTTSSAAAAAGGGAGKVWVNSRSKTFHCQGDRFYGKTKEGAYMTEAEAKAKGAHADHGKACT